MNHDMPMHGVASHEIKSHHVQEISNGCTWIRSVIDTSISLETVRILGILDILVSHARPFISFWVVHCEISYGRQVGYRTVYTAKFCMTMPRHIHVLYDLLVEIIMNPFEVVFFFLRFLDVFLSFPSCCKLLKMHFIYEVFLIHDLNKTWKGAL